VAKKKTNKTITVRITKDIMALGEKTLCDKCPTALALRVKGFKNVWVNYEDVSLNGEAGKKIVLSRRISKWIEDFDEGRAVRPITFKLKVPVGLEV
jgi:hypothetical protein